MVRISLATVTLTAAIAACGGGSSAPASSVADPVCGPQQYISAGACASLVINGLPDAAAWTHATDGSDGSDAAQGAADATDGTDAAPGADGGPGEPDAGIDDTTATR
jgi:hypothetical protein